MDANVKRIVNKQFSMAGIDFSVDKMSDSGYITIGKKEKLWYHVHKFPNKEMYEKWREWAVEELQKAGYSPLKIDMIDMTYGMQYPYEKENEQKKLF